MLLLGRNTLAINNSPSSNTATTSQTVTPTRVQPRPWQGVTVGRHRLQPGEFYDYSSPLFCIDLHLSHPYYLEWKEGNRFTRTHMTAGALCISPSHEPFSLRWSERLEIIKVTLSRPLVEETAASLNMRGDIIIPERHGDFDAQISHLSQALWAETDAGFPLGRVFGDSIGVALATCLLKRYNEATAQSSVPGKLSPRIWKHLQHFVEEHLESEISLEDMAQVAQLSPYHFSRCFKETTGTSPHQYLIARRIDRAQKLIADPALSLAEVALQSGFSDQSHLTRHMKRLLGVTPKALSPHRNRRKIVR
jgi:AraC family transcriptional regulator